MVLWTEPQGMEQMNLHGVLKFLYKHWWIKGIDCRICGIFARLRVLGVFFFAFTVKYCTGLSRCELECLLIV